jgi:hypothetical protein
MKRLSLFSLVAGLVLTGLFVACQDQPEPTSPPSVGLPQADISDALHPRNEGNRHFFWLSPVVPGPKRKDFNGEFDRTARPTVEIFELNGSPEAGSPATLERLVERFHPTEIDGFSDHFHVGWTPALSRLVDGDPLEDGDFVRVFVQFGTSELGEIVLRQLGYRDYEIGGSGNQRASTKGIGLTTTEALKFRIEELAGCLGDLPDNPVGPGNDVIPGCAICTLMSGASTCEGNDNQNALIVDAGTLPDGTQITALIEPVTLGPGESCVSFPDLPVDLAQYPDCLRITFSPREPPFTPGALLTFGFCVEHEGLMIDEGAQLPRARVLDQVDGQVFVLDQISVPDPICMPLSSLDSNPFIRFARGLLRRIRAPIAPKPLYATVAVRHEGIGGRGRSDYVGFAMPASLSALDNVDLGQVPINQPNDVSVVVLDEADFPVMNSFVTFTPDAGSDFNGSTSPARLSTFGHPSIDPPTNPPNGTAGGSWTLTTTGPHTLTASGVGYAEPPVTGINVPSSVDDLPTGIDYLPSTPVTVTFTANGFRMIEFLEFDLDGNKCPVILGPVEVLVRNADGDPAAGVYVLLEAFNNNGRPAKIEGDTYLPTGTDGIVIFSSSLFPLCITKTGAYRWRATASDLNITIDSEIHFNIRP